MELQEEFTGSNDHSPLKKHKRAKRKTPLSPPATTMMVTSSSSTTGSPRIPSPTSSGNNSTAKEEDDEDMANCLILLAQGDQKSDSTSPYDCKICSRTFPSFQALGGHRASHKKPKSDEEEEEKEEIKPKTNKMIIISPPFLFHSETKKAPLADTKSSSKAHGCSICGVAFSSGQALGGHMRRHRAPPGMPRTPTSDKVDTTDQSCEADDHHEPRKFMTLDLDLNLPAPFDDDFEFVGSKRRFVLSGPALVDCHY